MLPLSIRSVRVPCCWRSSSRCVSPCPAHALRSLLFTFCWFPRPPAAFTSYGPLVHPLLFGSALTPSLAAFPVPSARALRSLLFPSCCSSAPAAVLFFAFSSSSRCVLPLVVCAEGWTSACLPLLLAFRQTIRSLRVWVGCQTELVVTSVTRDAADSTQRD